MSECPCVRVCVRLFTFPPPPPPRSVGTPTAAVGGTAAFSFNAARVGTHTRTQTSVYSVASHDFLSRSLALSLSLSLFHSLSHTHAHIPTSELQYNEEDEEQGVESHDSELKVSLFLPRFLSLTLSTSCIACTHALYIDTPSLSCSGVQHIHVQTHIRTQHTHT